MDGSIDFILPRMALLRRSGTPFRFASQILAAMIQNHPLDDHLPSVSLPTLRIEVVLEVLQSTQSYFFQSASSIGRQRGFRRRSPLRQRRLREEAIKREQNLPVSWRGARRDAEKVELGLMKSIEFFNWVESRLGFTHNEITCREMACVLAKGNSLRILWEFLKSMSRRTNGGLVTTATVTSVIKLLGEEGLVDEAEEAFYRMRRYHCRPDVHAYNALILALCRVRKFKKAKFMLEKMELPGFSCPPDTFTYTILISSYCKHSTRTVCKKAIRMRLWQANRFFRWMIFKGFAPDVVTYNALIDGCCKTYRIERALELFHDMSPRGCPPNRVTYNSFIRYYSVVNEIDEGVAFLRMMEKMKHGIPTSSSYTPIIHALCEAGRAVEARDFLVEMVNAGSVPREYSYRLVCNALRNVDDDGTFDVDVRRKIEDRIKWRAERVVKFNPPVW